MAETLIHLLRRAQQAPRADGGLRFVDLRERERFFAWPEVVDRAARSAGTLQRLGVRPGDRVAIVSPTEIGFMDAFFGALWAGAIPVPLYPPVRLGRLDEYIGRTAAMLAAVQAAVVVVESRVQKLFGGVMERHRPTHGLLALDRLPLGEPVAAAILDEEDIGLIQFSSGTTAEPKPVALSHRALLANLDRILDLLPEPSDPPQAGVSWLPLYHDMGLIGCLFPALARGGPLTLLSPEVFLARPALWLRAISRHRGTATTAPNFAYALCLSRVSDEELVGVDLSSLRVALNGAEPIAARTLRDFAARFAPYGFDPAAMMPVYGMSEAALAVTFSERGPGPVVLRAGRAALLDGSLREAQGEEPAIEIVSVGRALRGFAVEVRGPTGDPLPAGQIGGIFVQGPSLLSRYWNGAPSPLRDGWLETGDLGALIDGQLYITGRAKDLLILRGRNHAPQTLELVADGVPGVRTGCTAAVAIHGEEGEQLVIFVESHAPPPGLAEAVRTAILAEQGLEPDLVVVLEPGTLPRTSSGKMRRGEAARRWMAGTLEPPEEMGALRLAGKMAQSYLGYWRSRNGAR